MTSTATLPTTIEGLPLVIRRSKQAKRIIMRLAPDGSALRITLPARMNERKAFEFAHAQAGWIRQQKAKKSAPQPFAPEMEVPLFGAPCRLRHEPTQRGVRYTEGELIVGGMIGSFHRRVEAWIIKQAQQRFATFAIEAAAKMGQRPASVTLRDTRSRWGSCSKARRINLSWRLALAPAEVFEYVICHEVAHLQHFDHSPAFWQCVDQLTPHANFAKGWLKQHGRDLHRWAIPPLS